MHYSQPEYIFTKGEDVRHFWKVGFRLSCYHDSDHRAVVATICRGWTGRLKSYQRERQRFPMQLPTGPHDALTTTFEELKAACIEPTTPKRSCKDWVSAGTWQLMKQRTSLKRAGQLCQSEAGRTLRTIHSALRADRVVRTAQVCESITHELAGGNVHKAFHHLKGWYQSATEMQAQPCFQTMEKQTTERVDL